MNFISFSFRIVIESLKSSDWEVSIMSFEVAPKWTYSPALPSHASAKAFTQLQAFFEACFYYPRLSASLLFRI